MAPGSWKQTRQLTRPHNHAPAERLHPESNITSYSYDRVNRREAMVDAEGRITTQTYYPDGQLKEVIDPKGKTVLHNYDKANRLTSQIDPLGNRTTFAYDDAGNRTLRINARGQRVTMAYDGVGRLTDEFYPGGRRHTYTYDKAGNRDGMTDATGSYATTYEPRNLPKTVTNPDGKTVSYGYNALGQRSSMTDPSGPITNYFYDAAHRLEIVVNPQAKVTTFIYDDAGRLTGKQFDNGAVTSHVYDKADRVTVVANRKSDGSAVNIFTYTYDDAGNRTRMIDASGVVTTWAYDKTYQLEREQRSGASGFDVSYSYDDAGNRELQTDSSGATVYEYDDANRLLSEDSSASGVTTYSYDADGNRTTKQTPSEITYYTWDEDSQLTEAEPIAGPVTLTYTADGRRVMKETPTETKKFIYDQKKLLQETDAIGNVDHQYTSTTEEYGELISEYDGADTSYHQYDALGSTDALLSGSETATDRYEHRAFGLQESHTGSSANPFTFVGREGYYRDAELDLYLAGARYYDPALGRWTSKDPISFGGGDANLYRYVKNNPLIRADPSGLLDYRKEFEKAVEEMPNDAARKKIQELMEIKSFKGKKLWEVHHWYSQEDSVRKWIEGLPNTIKNVDAVEHLSLFPYHVHGEITFQQRKFWNEIADELGIPRRGDVKYERVIQAVERLPGEEQNAVFARYGKQVDALKKEFAEFAVDIKSKTPDIDKAATNAITGAMPKSVAAKGRGAQFKKRQATYDKSRRQYMQDVLDVTDPRSGAKISSILLITGVASTLGHGIMTAKGIADPSPAQQLAYHNFINQYRINLRRKMQNNQSAAKTIDLHRAFDEWLVQIGGVSDIQRRVLWERFETIAAGQP